ncbi:MAG: TetR/AcrR family transcriptional regulator [Rhodovulum sulfidophilum]|uniref:TetR/AcrR family transcriptional regulator n=1 Tax=Rhodovulum sulfidophilum TaxID=35806 RepID=A0A2W5NKV3_RHOSU|nr:MAG: TetR/AcrR family transcriptional regulator [Rhodovulum sulfidophilum]
MPKISEERRAARRAQILEAAWTCFQRQGLHATTMDDIIRGSGLSAGAVYSYFPGKEDLIVAAVTTSLGDLRALFAPVLLGRPVPGPDELLRRIAGIVTSYTAHESYDLRRIALLGWAEAQRNERLRETMRGFYLPFRERLEEVAAVWRSEGVVEADAGAAEIAKLIFAAILGFVAQSAILDDVAAADLGDGLRGLMREPPA